MLQNVEEVYFVCYRMLKLTIFTRLGSRRVVMFLVMVYVRSFVSSFVSSFVPSLIQPRVFNIF